MKPQKFIYSNIFQTSTLQFDGYIRQYFVENSHRVVCFYILPRGGGVRNFLELYVEGRLIRKQSLFSPSNIILCYIFYYVQYLYIIFSLFSLKETVYFINHLPVFFFFNSVIRKLRSIEIVYWIADYWPMENLSIRIFRWFMNFYHNRSLFRLYITDRINKAMNNGKIVRKSGRKTVMLGIDPSLIDLKKRIGKKVTLCFIGVLVESQGIDIILKVVAENENIYLKLIGTGDVKLTEKCKKLIKLYNIANKVYFPNKFFYGKELHKIAKNCDIGIVLYKEDKNSVSYYADPAKIKQYAQFGLPIVMTDTAEIAEYIKKFHTGEVVKNNKESVIGAIKKIKNNYEYYLIGVKKFNEHFNYKKYYKNAFRFLEI